MSFVLRGIDIPAGIRDRFSSRVLLGIGLGSVAVLFLLPLLFLLVQSFQAGDSVFESYQRVFSGVYLASIYRSLLYGLVTTIVTLILGYALAYYIAFRANNAALLLALVVLPLWIAYIIRYLGIQLFLSPTGPVVDLFGTDFGLLFSTAGVIVGLTSAFLPFAILPMYNSLSSVDQSVVHASRVMGAGPITTVYKVVFPLTLSGVIAAGLIVFILSSGSFLGPAILGGPGDLMIANVIEDAYSSLGNIPLAAALSVVYTIILVVLLTLFNSYVNLGEVFSNL